VVKERDPKSTGKSKKLKKKVIYVYESDSDEDDAKRIGGGTDSSY
jgi:hypothetical protein